MDGIGSGEKRASEWRPSCEATAVVLAEVMAVEVMAEDRLGGWGYWS